MGAVLWTLKAATALAILSGLWPGTATGGEAGNLLMCRCAPCAPNLFISFTGPVHVNRQSSGVEKVFIRTFFPGCRSSRGGVSKNRCGK